MPRSNRNQLTDAIRTRQLLQCERRVENGWTTGYVLDIGPEFFLLALVSDKIWFDGFECFRMDDITGIRRDPYSAFIEAALKQRGEIMPESPAVDLTTIGKLLVSASSAFPLVTIHREEVKPDVCHIGRVVAVNRSTMSLLEINPGATWDSSPTDYQIAQITRVSFGGDYEEALHLVGGAPPAIGVRS